MEQGAGFSLTCSLFSSFSYQVLWAEEEHDQDCHSHQDRRPVPIIGAAPEDKAAGIHHRMEQYCHQDAAMGVVEDPREKHRECDYPNYEFPDIGLRKSTCEDWIQDETGVKPVMPCRPDDAENKAGNQGIPLYLETG